MSPASGSSTPAPVVEGEATAGYCPHGSVVGCRSVQQTSKIAGSTPAMQRCSVPGKTEGWLINKRGQRLYLVAFEPPAGKTVARLFFHHGLGEHSSRYDKGKLCMSLVVALATNHLVRFRAFHYAVFARFAEQGIAVYSYDAHGHGKSQPLGQTERALVLSFQYLASACPPRYGAPSRVVPDGLWPLACRWMTCLRLWTACCSGTAPRACPCSSRGTAWAAWPPRTLS